MVRKLYTLALGLMLLWICVPAQAQAGRFSASDLDQMLKPIALYPDPLLAQLLPAAAYPAEIEAAARYLQSCPNGAGIEAQPWDSSVKALAHYPDVIHLLGQDLDWTNAIGQAFANQMTDVSNSIQRLRRLAYSYGNLQSCQQQLVTNDQGFVSIYPTDAQSLYVPNYDPTTVYAPRNFALDQSPLDFSLAYSCGPWLMLGMDWLSGGCFSYPGGGYWGPGGGIFESAYYDNNYYTTTTYVHNYYNPGNRCAWRLDRPRYDRTHCGERYSRSHYDPSSRRNYYSQGTSRGYRSAGGSTSSRSHDWSRYQSYSRTSRPGYSQPSLNTQERRHESYTPSWRHGYSQPGFTTPSRPNSHHESASAPARPSYSTPAFTAPSRPNSHHESASAPARPSYSMPAFTAPSRPNSHHESASAPARPSYSMPAFTAPSRPSYSHHESASAPSRPSFSLPSYSAPSRPSFSQPSYSPPSRPSFSQPSYSAPSRSSHSQPSSSGNGGHHHRGRTR